MPYSQRADGLEELRRELELLPDKVLDGGERVVGQGMLNVKRDASARRQAQNLAHAPHVHRSYDYSVTKNQRVIRGEGGADTAKLQGGIDIYLEMGTATSAPHPVWGPALDAELPRFERYAEEYLARLLQ